MANKFGLADLKKLRKQSDQDVATAAAQNSTSKPGNVKPKGLDAKTGQAKTLEGAPALSVQDLTLFRQVMRHVQPLKDTRRAILPPAPLAAKNILKGRRAAAQGADTAILPTVSDLFEAPQHHASDGYLRHGMGPDVLKNLKRDKWPIEASIDLHGATLEQARERLDQFLQSCLTHGIKCVRIVHGKGYGSRDGTPVLKEVVRRWLTQFDAVLAYAECSENNGGAGAVQALLKK